MGRDHGAGGAVAALRAEEGVQAVPGHYFGGEGYLRIGFDSETTDGAEACARIAAWLRRATRA